MHFSAFIPKVRLRSHQRPKWITPTVQHDINCFRPLKKKYKSHATQYNLTKLLSAESLLEDKLKLAKSSYENNLSHKLANSESNKIYAYIYSLSSKHSLPPLMHFDSLSATTDSVKASLFNNYFYSIFTRSSFVLPTIDELPSVDSLISDISISDSDVYSELTKLDTSKAMGIDNIGPKILKFCAPALYLPIHHLFSLSLSHQCLPAEWCIHSIVPVFKSGDRTSIINYRPISLLCTISLVLERLIYNKVLAVASNRISSFQFGFTKNRSTVHQLLLFINQFFSSFGQKVQTDVIYLDFRKAFDSVPHNELLLKLWLFGITGNLWLWFKAYLTSRKQLVSVNHCFSTTLPVLSGVPQGSILGPLLFLIYVNDLQLSASSSSLLLFADDTKCFNMVYSPSDSLVLQQDLTSLFNWSNHWKLSFNELKCILIRFSASHPAVNVSYFLNQHQLSATNSHKDLGIIVSSNLDWTDHYNYISDQAHKTFGLPRRTFRNCNSTYAKKILYLSLVRPKLTYCSCVWRPYLIKDIVTLENVQQRAIKFILNE